MVTKCQLPTTVSHPRLAEDRTLRQANFVRAVMAKIADDHLVANPVTMVRVLNSIAAFVQQHPSVLTPATVP